MTVRINLVYRRASDLATYIKSLLLLKRLNNEKNTMAKNQSSYALQKSQPVSFYILYFSSYLKLKRNGSFHLRKKIIVGRAWFYPKNLWFLRKKSHHLMQRLFRNNKDLTFQSSSSLRCEPPAGRWSCTCLGRSSSATSIEGSRPPRTTETASTDWKQIISSHSHSKTLNESVFHK